MVERKGTQRDWKFSILFFFFFVENCQPLVSTKKKDVLETPQMLHNENSPNPATPN